MSDILLTVLVGLSGGIAVGSGFVAFITVLDVIPRLAQLSSGQRFVKHYEWSLIAGAVFWTVMHQFDLAARLPGLFLLFYGLIAGIFVGMLAAALTEVLNVIPVLAKRIGMYEKIVVFLMAMALGKVLGSLFQWIYFE